VVPERFFEEFKGCVIDGVGKRRGPEGVKVEGGR
jgi:hypothetical protein